MAINVFWTVESAIGAAIAFVFLADRLSAMYIDRRAGYWLAFAVARGQSIAAVMFLTILCLSTALGVMALIGTTYLRNVFVWVLITQNTLLILSIFTLWVTGFLVDRGVMMAGDGPETARMLAGIASTGKDTNATGNDTNERVQAIEGRMTDVEEAQDAGTSQP